MTTNPIRLGDALLDPPVFLAPMAGITVLPFRRAVARHGAGLVVSEMVASTEMVTPRPSTRAAVRAKAMVEENGVPVSVQIAGREPGPMAETARIVADMGAGIIDINMGCPARKVTGGLSGAPLAPLARSRLTDFRTATGGAVPLVAVGGIASGEEAYARIRAGASLVQLYTGLVYEGPGLAARMLRDLDALLQRDGFSSVAEAVG